MIYETRYAFGLDTERYNSIPEQNKWMDWKYAALHINPTITFVAARATISWGYQDNLFPFNWQGIRDMDKHRFDVGIEAYPVGRMAYHVLYPAENAIRQVDNFFRVIGDNVDWEHDRLVIDNELHHNQSKRTITDCTKTFAYKCKERTGRYPIHYARSLWLNQYTYPQELTFMDLWLAQYLSHQWWLGIYTDEYPPPPNPLPYGFNTWLIHQTADRGKPIGSPVKKVMDYNRWNGGAETVAKYFGYSDTIEQPEEPVVDFPVFSQNDSRWASEKLGTSSVTIGGYGCLVTAAAMICKHYGKDTDPSRLNKALIGVNGYESGNLLNYNSITKIYPDIVVDWDEYKTSPILADLDRILPTPVIVQVDLKPDTSALDQHWVVVIGKDSNGYIIADPIDGSITYLSRYDNKIFRTVVYKHTQSTEEPVSVPLDALEQLWAHHPELH